MLKVVTDEQFLSKFTELNSLVKAMVTHLGHNLANELDIITNEEEYKYTFTLKALDGSILSNYVIDLPLESIAVDGTYDEENKSIVITLHNGNKIIIPVENIISGLATTAQLNSEAEAREAADNALSASIAAEATARNTADEALSGRINAEAATRAGDVANLNANIAMEAATRQQADEQLQENIDNVPFFVGADGYIYGKD